MDSQKYAALKAKIVQAVPEISYIAECIKCRGKGELGEYPVDFIETCRDCDGAGDYRVSRKIGLTDVLRAIIANDTQNAHLVILSMVLPHHEGGVLISNGRWDLFNDSLDEQSEETKDFLYSLLCNE